MKLVFSAWGIHMEHFLNTTLLGICKQFFADSGAAAVLILLGVALFAFAPANLASIKNLKARGLIALLNFASIGLLSARFYIPLALWGLAFFLAVRGRRRLPKPDRPPSAPLPPNAQNRQVSERRPYEKSRTGFY